MVKQMFSIQTVIDTDQSKFSMKDLLGEMNKTNSLGQIAEPR